MHAQKPRSRPVSPSTRNSPKAPGSDQKRKPICSLEGCPPREMTKQMRISTTMMINLINDIQNSISPNTVTCRNCTNSIVRVSRYCYAEGVKGRGAHVDQHDDNREGGHKYSDIQIRPPILYDDSRGCEVVGEDDGVLEKVIPTRCKSRPRTKLACTIRVYRWK